MGTNFAIFESDFLYLSVMLDGLHNTKGESAALRGCL